MATVALVAADALGRYGFPHGHPFGPDRQEAFLRELKQSTAYGSLQVLTPRVAEREEIEYFHDRAYVDLVVERSIDGRGYLDAGDAKAPSVAARARPSMASHAPVSRYPLRNSLHRLV